MVITIDIGNTDIVCVLYNLDGTPERYQRVSLIQSRIKEDTDYFVMELIRTWHIDDVDYIVSCVVPSIIKDLKVSLSKFFSSEGTFIDYTDALSMVEDLNYPAEIGSDLLAASYAVSDIKTPTLIVDMGSATKYILVNNQKLEGVSILLGVKNNMLALNTSIKHLPNVELQFTENPLGIDTISSIQSGLMYSTLYTIQGYALSIDKQMGVTTNKILTGGISNLFKDHLDDFTFIPNLVNDGLFKMYTRKKGMK